MNLSTIFDEPVGYHGAAWVDLTDGQINIDRPVPEALFHFLTEVSHHANELDLPERIGTAYVRVIDAGQPENYMTWHRDNADGGVRFHVAISTDGRLVNLAFLHELSHDLVGQSVEDTWQHAHWDQHPNGTLVMFTDEPHGVLPQPPRPNERTAVFFATLYMDRASADLYMTNNTTTANHAALPQLEDAR